MEHTVTYSISTWHNQLHCCEEESPTTVLKESQLLALEDISSTRCLHSATTIYSDLIHPCLHSIKFPALQVYQHPHCQTCLAQNRNPSQPGNCLGSIDSKHPLKTHTHTLFHA